MLNKKFLAMLLASVTLVSAPTMADDDWDDDDDDRPRKVQVAKTNKKTNYISHQQARQKAQTVGRVVSDVDFDNDSTYGAVYETEVINKKGQKRDIKISAKTGKVVYNKPDRDDD